MSSAVPLKERVESILRKRTEKDVEQAPAQPTVLIATVDPEIRSGLEELFSASPLNTIWMNGVKTAKRLLAIEKVAACLCSFWLQDGTYGQLVRHIRREHVEIPVIIVSSPTCPMNTAITLQQ